MFLCGFLNAENTGENKSGVNTVADATCGIDRRGTMVGFIYRRAIALKDFGERHNIGFCIRLGLALREWVSKYPIY